MIRLSASISMRLMVGGFSSCGFPSAPPPLFFLFFFFVAFLKHSAEAQGFTLQNSDHHAGRARDAAPRRPSSHTRKPSEYRSWDFPVSALSSLLFSLSTSIDAKAGRCKSAKEGEGPSAQSVVGIEDVLSLPQRDRATGEDECVRDRE